MKRARFLEPALLEFEEQIAYFDQQVTQLGDRFEQEVRLAVSLATEHPKLGPALSKRLRKLRLRTFPFNIIYAVEEDEIVIIAVAPHRRRPNYWRGRLSSNR